jgi:hypothetical protein
MSHNLVDKLADEVILDIIKYLGTDYTNFSGPLNRHLRNLSLCNERLRRIVLPSVYHTVYLDNSKSLDGILEIMIEFPKIAVLVKSLVLVGRSRTDNLNITAEAPMNKLITPHRPKYPSLSSMLGTNYWIDRVWAPMWSTSRQKRTRDASPSSPTMNQRFHFKEEAIKRDLPREFVHCVEKRHSWAHTLLLLHVVQHLEEVRIETNTNELSKLDLYLCEFLKERALSTQLKTFIRDPNTQIFVGTLIPAFLLPSMTQIRCGFAFSYGALDIRHYLPQGVTMTSLYRTSNVEKLVLKYAAVSGHDLAELLRLPLALKSFTYQGSSYSDWFQERILDSIKQALDHTAKSLEFLDMEYHAGCFEDGSTVWSLQNFSSLKVLIIDSGLLYGLEPPHDSTPISESLPPKLEILAMRSPYEDPYQAFEEDPLWTTSKYIDLWRRLLASKSKTVLPHLRLVANLSDFHFLQPLSDLATSRNVKIALYEDDMCEIAE